MTTTTEIAPDLFRISTYVPDADLQFCQFLLRDDEPFLFHTGLMAIFPSTHEAVAKLVDPARIRWLAWSHFEADECGALNEWLAQAPQAQAVCGLVAAVVSVNDFALRPARTVEPGEVLSTGKRRLRFQRTPHVPHGWDAGLFFEETTETLLCSDLFTQRGDLEPVTESDILDRSRQTLVDYQAGPFADYLPYTPYTEKTLQSLANLKPKRLATMHGTSYVGDGEGALRSLAALLKETYGGPR